MANNGTGNGSQPKQVPEGITRITVGGFKSISTEQSIEIKPLTLLAGANSSGKSSIMQPLLLLKQTLEAPYDPGPLLLNGPNARFSSTDQLLTRLDDRQTTGFSVRVDTDKGIPIAILLERTGDGLEISGMTLGSEVHYRLDLGMSHDHILETFPQIKTRLQTLSTDVRRAVNDEIGVDVKEIEIRFGVVRNRCFLDLAGTARYGKVGRADLTPVIKFGDEIETYLIDIIHLPGLRGNPARTYPKTATGSRSPGTFDNYTASVIADWQQGKQQDKLMVLHQELSHLGLTNAITAMPINDTQVELRVGRLPHSTDSEQDMVSIADVGFGVSQTLPVIVALLAAEPGQMVYIEQPEIHLHPRAQTAMAQVLADAATRGVRVVAETHSSLLLLGVQTLVAEGKLSPELVKLHWFTRGDDGATTLQSADLDETGAFGDWPEDFDDVTLNAQSRYMDAAEARLAVK